MNSSVGTLLILILVCLSSCKSSTITSYHPSNQSFVIWCKGIYGLLTKKQGQASGSDKNLPAVLRPESIFLINLVFPKPYTLIAPETKTTDPMERRIKKMSDLRETEKFNGNSTPSPPKSAYNQKKQSDDENKI